MFASLRRNCGGKITRSERAALHRAHHSKQVLSAVHNRQVLSAAGHQLLLRTHSRYVFVERSEYMHAMHSFVWSNTKRPTSLVCRTLVFIVSRDSVVIFQLYVRVLPEYFCEELRGIVVFISGARAPLTKRHSHAHCLLSLSFLTMCWCVRVFICFSTLAAIAVVSITFQLYRGGRALLAGSHKQQTHSKHQEVCAILEGHTTCCWQCLSLGCTMPTRLKPHRCQLLTSRCCVLSLPCQHTS